MKSLQIDEEAWKKLKIESIETGLSLKDIVSSKIGGSKFFVYELTLENNDKYIGFTSDIFSRIIGHKNTKKVESIRILKKFDKKQEALEYEKKMIISTNNINNSNLENIPTISNLSNKFSEILYSLLHDKLSNNDIVLRLDNGYINKRALDAYCTNVAEKTINIKRKFDEFEQELSYKEGIDFKLLTIGGVGDTDTFFHPMLAFDICRQSSPKTRIFFTELLLFQK